MGYFNELIGYLQRNELIDFGISFVLILFLAIFVTMLSIEIMFLLSDSFSSSMLLGFIIK